MKRASLLAIVFVAVTGIYHSSAFAVSLTDSALTDAQFSTFAGSQTSSQISNFTIGLTTGTLYSASFQGTGAAAGHTVYVYQLNLNTGAATGTSLNVGGINNLVTDLHLTGGTQAVSSFYVTGGLTSGGGLASFFGANGLVAPISSLVTDVTGDYQTLFASLAAGTSSMIFGYVSDGGSTVVGSAIDIAGSFTAGATGVAPAPIPEPATLLLLGSGLTGMVAWGWRRHAPRRARRAGRLH